MNRIAFIDTETTGLDPERHVIWEIAVVKESTAEVIQVTVSPAALRAADPIALRINGFNDRYDPDASMAPRDAIDWFVNEVGGRTLAGVNPAFDEQRLRLMYDAVYATPERYPWPYHLIDVSAMALGYLHRSPWKHPDVTIELKAMPPYKSDRLAELLGVPPRPEIHTALTDAQWAKAQWDRMTQWP